MANESAAVGPRPTPRIDHVMILLDAVAYDDVAASGFLGDRFARIKRKEADSSIAGSYATLGVAGDNSLVELFRAGAPGTAAMTGGLVFSFEEPGSHPVARSLLDADGVAYHADLVRRTVEGMAEQQPWYHLISVDLGRPSPLLLFLNEVTPEYFESLGAAREPGGAMRRADYLDAVLGEPANGKKLLRDITGVSLTVRTDRANRIAAALAAVGYTDTGHPAARELRGPGLDLRLTVDESADERVTEIRIDLVPGLRGPDTPAELRFGRTSRLVIEPDDTARWIFAPAGQHTRSAG